MKIDYSSSLKIETLIKPHKERKIKRKTGIAGMGQQRNEMK